MSKTLTGVIAFLFCLTQSAVAAEVDYVRDIKPVFKHRCFACHGALKQESGLRLDTPFGPFRFDVGIPLKRALFKGGEGVADQKDDAVMYHFSLGYPF